MKITEIITERQDMPVNGNDTACIARTSKEAVKMFKKADKGAKANFDPKKAREKVRDLYGVELVDDFIDVLELPNAEKGTDKEMSMFSKDNR